MNRVLIRAVIMLVTFAVGVGSSAVWTSRLSNAVPTPIPSGDCAPYYDADLLINRLREEDDPALFSAFQELPVYALPECVDEAYSLVWVPSFHEPVLVRVWHSGDGAFMVAKSLDSKGWSKFGNVQQSHSRPLTDFEWRNFRDLLNRSSYWKLPSNVYETLPQDGAVWLIDGFRTKQYHWVRRRVPDEQYAEICKHLIRLSGLETAHPLYLPLAPGPDKS